MQNFPITWDGEDYTVTRVRNVHTGTIGFKVAGPRGAYLVLDGCNCPGWIYSGAPRGSELRTCKHMAITATVLDLVETSRRERAARAATPACWVCEGEGGWDDALNGGVWHDCGACARPQQLPAIPAAAAAHIRQLADSVPADAAEASAPEGQQTMGGYLVTETSDRVTVQGRHMTGSVDKRTGLCDCGRRNCHHQQAVYYASLRRDAEALVARRKAGGR